MKDDKKGKWILGLSGFAIAAMLLPQLQTSSSDDTATATKKEAAIAPSPNATLEEFSEADQKKMGNKETELVQLDWTDFEVQTVSAEGKVIQTTVQQPVPYTQPQQSYRQSRRS